MAYRVSILLVDAAGFIRLRSAELKRFGLFTRFGDQTFFATVGEAEVATDAFRRGASGYLPKNAVASELITAVREVLRGKS